MNLQDAKFLAEEGELDQAWEICNDFLKRDPNDGKALVLTSFILEKSGRNTIAYHLCKRIVDLYPNQPVGWINLGRCADNLWLMDEALTYYRTALKKTNDKNLYKTAYLNISAVYLQIGDFKNARVYAIKALEIEPGNRKATHNLGLCQLANKEWADGWKNYHASLGSGNRIKYQYNNEPEWDGSPNKNIVIFGEQGLGDEICAASMFGDAIKISNKVIIDCDKRLENLFKRSFPNATIYGTRNKKDLNWKDEDTEIDASIASMQLGQLFRNKDSDFSGEPYLIADKDRVLMWKSLWATKNKPVIGLAWTGGIESTGAIYRNWKLEQLIPVFKSIDAHWVCLQYRDAEKEINEFKKLHNVDLVQYRYATLTNDYDDTAALVASLDSVFSMQTSVIHLAGALGIKTWCGVPSITQWRYGTSGDSIPWYKSVKLFRGKNGNWDFPKDII